MTHGLSTSDSLLKSAEDKAYLTRCFKLADDIAEQVKQRGFESIAEWIVGFKKDLITSYSYALPDDIELILSLAENADFGLEFILST